MQIKNITISANSFNQGYEQNQKNEKKSNTIFAGNLNMETESPLQQRREQAQKKAMKVVSDTFEMDKSLDADVQSHKDNMKSLQNENLDMLDEMKSLQEKIDSEETDEAQADEYKATMSEYQKRIDANKIEIKSEAQVVQGIKLERLKSHPMVDATKQADAINAAATDEMVAGIISEAKDHIDEQMQENQEDGQALQDKLKEQQDALQESVDSQKEKQENAQDEASDITKQLTEGADLQDDINKKLDEIKDKMNLLEEDLKGVAVDTQL